MGNVCARDDPAAVDPRKRRRHGQTLTVSFSNDDFHNIAHTATADGPEPPPALTTTRPPASPVPSLRSSLRASPRPREGPSSAPADALPKSCVLPPPRVLSAVPSLEIPSTVVDLADDRSGHHHRPGSGPDDSVLPIRPSPNPSGSRATPSAADHPFRHRGASPRRDRPGEDAMLHASTSRFGPSTGVFRDSAGMSFATSASNAHALPPRPPRGAADSAALSLCAVSVGPGMACQQPTPTAAADPSPAGS
mmetsp:Transcript_46338/g.142954  ORF Transcript_46338/g.142954 Transcript_46338/m.142954 type:complete len:250 (+) Transcript_46338:113-862(+)